MRAHIQIPEILDLLPHHQRPAGSSELYYDRKKDSHVAKKNATRESRMILAAATTTNRKRERKGESVYAFSSIHTHI